MKVTQETKTKLFEKVLELEHMGEKPTFDGRDYVEQSNGAYEMLKILGLGREYINWAMGK